MQIKFCFINPEVFNLPPPYWIGFDPQESISLQPEWTMAHIAVAMELFPSLGQARKNGWSDPIPEGYTERFKIGKMNKALYIYNPPEIFFQS